MAQIIQPEIVNLSGNLVIIQGSDYYLQLQIKDVDGIVVDLSGVDQATQIFSEFRTDYFALSPGTPGSTVGCPVPRWYIPAATADQGIIWLHIPSVQTKWTSTQVLGNSNHKWDMEMIIDGYRCRPFMGNWQVDGLQVTIRYSV